MRSSTRWLSLHAVSRVPLPLILPVLILALGALGARTAFRWFSGAPMSGRRTSNATFWQPATEVVASLPGWFDTGLMRKWIVLAGWTRAAVRLAITVALIGLVTYPRTTLIVVAGFAVAFGARRGIRIWEWWGLRKHTKNVVAPMYATLRQYIGTPEDARPSAWVDVPMDYLDNKDAVIRVFFPTGFDLTQKAIGSIKGVVARHLGRQWELGRTEVNFAEWRRVPPLPRNVPYADVIRSLDRPSAYKIPMGVIARNRVPLVDLTTDSPHYFVVGSGGAGKTSHLRIPITHVRVHGGWLVDVVDLKQSSFYEAYDATTEDLKEGIKEMPAVPGIRIHTDTQSAVWAISEFFLSMFGANMNRQDETIPRLLVFDEFGSFITFLRMWWRSMNMPGAMPPIMDIMQVIAFQGRQANHRIIIGVHDFDRQLFGSVGFRNMFDYRAYLGPPNLSRYRTTFGAAPMVKHSAEITGRGLLALGEGAPDEIQFAFISNEQARAATKDLDAPEWFTRRQLAPWVTDAVIERVIEELGTIRKKGSKEDLSLLSILMGGRDPHAAQTITNVQGQRQGNTDTGDTAPAPAPAPRMSPIVTETDDEDDQLTADDEPDDDVESDDIDDQDDDENDEEDDQEEEKKNVPERPRLRLVTPNEEPALVGIRAAVEYLQSAGWPTMTHASFTKARQRWRKERRAAEQPVELPGETEGPGGQPQFTPTGLRQWQSRRDRAGRQNFQTGTD